MRSAAVYRKKERLIVHPHAETTAGVLISIEPFIVLGNDSSADIVGGAVLRALRAFRAGVPHPDPDGFRAFLAPLLTAAKVRSWSAFVKNAQYCDVDEVGEEFLITPTRNEGARGGFIPLKDRRISLTRLASANQIGEAVLKALQDCE